MPRDEDHLISTAELETRVIPRVRERLASAGVPPEEAESVLAEALEYVRLRAPGPREIVPRFLFAVDRACRRFEEALRDEIERGLDELYGSDRRGGAAPGEEETP